jgi:hypothetical protein
MAIEQDIATVRARLAIPTYALLGRQGLDLGRALILKTGTGIQ